MTYTSHKNKNYRCQKLKTQTKGLGSNTNKHLRTPAFNQKCLMLKK